MSSSEEDEQQQQALEAVSTLSALFAAPVAAAAQPAPASPRPTTLKRKANVLKSSHHNSQPGSSTSTPTAGPKKKHKPEETAEDDEEDDATYEEPTSAKKTAKGSNDKHIKCYAKGCKNNAASLAFWKNTVCPTHNISRGSCECRYKQPFMMFCLQRPTTLLTCLFCELVLSDPKIVELSDNKVVAASWRVCSDHFHPSMAKHKNAFPVLGLGKSHHEILTIALRYGVAHLLPLNFLKISLNVIRGEPCFKLLRDTSKASKVLTMPAGWNEGEEIRSLVDFYQSGGRKEEVTAEGAKIEAEAKLAEAIRENGGSTDEDEDRKRFVRRVMSIQSQKTQPKRGEPGMYCSAENCANKMLAEHCRYLPEDVEEGIDWILAVKSDSYQQNFWLQRYIESAWRGKRDGGTDWLDNLGFKVCPRHFENKDDAMPTMNLPSAKRDDISNPADFLRRKNFFYMYGVQRDVSIPKFINREEKKIAPKVARISPVTRLICNIPNCTTTTMMMNGPRLYRVFPAPYDPILRREWHDSMRAHGHLHGNFTLPAMGVVCEKHFVHGGRTPTGEPEMPSKELGIPAEFAPKDDDASALPSSPSTSSGTQPSKKITKRCLVRCCPVNSSTRRAGGRGLEYIFLPLPVHPVQRESWLQVLKKADPLFEMQHMSGNRLHYVCERHFKEQQPRDLRLPAEQLIPTLKLTPEDAQSFANFPSVLKAIDDMAEMSDSDMAMVKKRLRCCDEVLAVQGVLQRLHYKMNTLVQSVTRLCSLSRIKETVVAEFFESEDDFAMYGETGKLSDNQTVVQYLQTVKGMAEVTAGASAELERLEGEYKRARRGEEHGEQDVQEVQDYSAISSLLRGRQEGMDSSEEDEDEEEGRLKSNNDLLMQLLGNALPGQVEGEILEDDDVNMAHDEEESEDVHEMEEEGSPEMEEHQDVEDEDVQEENENGKKGVEEDKKMEEAEEHESSGDEAEDAGDHADSGHREDGDEGELTIVEDEEEENEEEDEKQEEEENVDEKDTEGEEEDKEGDEDEDEEEEEKEDEELPPTLSPAESDEGPPLLFAQPPSILSEQPPE